MASRAILSNLFDEQWTQNHPKSLSGLLRALLATTFLEIAVYIFSIFKFIFLITCVIELSK